MGYHARAAKSVTRPDRQAAGPPYASRLHRQPQAPPSATRWAKSERNRSLDSVFARRDGRPVPGRGKMRYR